jgi:hypothetical protein
MTVNTAITENVCISPHQGNFVLKETFIGRKSTFLVIKDQFNTPKLLVNQ